MPKVQAVAPNTLVVDVRKGVMLRTMESGRENNLNDHLSRHTDSHDGEPHHTETGGKDPHIWLDPMIVKIQARTMCDALVQHDPAGKDYYEANLGAFLHDLDVLHASMTKALAPINGEVIFVFHPAFGYLCDAFGLKQMAVELEGKAPKGRELTRFIKKAKSKNVRVIFVQPQFDRNTAQKIAIAINGAVLPIDPLAFDYIANMEKIANTIAQTLKK